MVRSVTLQKLKWSPLTSVVLPPVALKAIPKALLLNTLLPCVPVQVHWTDGFSFKNVCIFKMSSCFTILLWQVFLWQLQKNKPKNHQTFPTENPFSLVSFKPCRVRCVITGFIVLNWNRSSERCPGAMRVCAVALIQKFHLAAKFLLQLWSCNEITS